MSPLVLACGIALTAAGAALVWFRTRARNQLVILNSADAYFNLQGKAVKSVLKQLGTPSSIVSIPGAVTQKQYRYDSADKDYVIFLFAESTIIDRVNLVKKTEWPTWSGHKGKGQ